MAKKKSLVYYCTECGTESAKWQGQCPGCGAWNTMEEAPVTKKMCIRDRTKGKTKWFRVQYKIKKKKVKGYIKESDVKMNLKSSAAGLVTGVKTALRVRKKPGTKGAYYKIRGKELVLAKKQYVTITKVRTVKKQKWYQIAFDRCV